MKNKCTLMIQLIAVVMLSGCAQDKLITTNESKWHSIVLLKEEIGSSSSEWTWIIENNINDDIYYPVKIQYNGYSIGPLAVFPDIKFSELPMMYTDLRHFKKMIVRVDEFKSNDNVTQVKVEVIIHDTSCITSSSQTYIKSIPAFFNDYINRIVKIEDLIMGSKLNLVSLNDGFVTIDIVENV